MKTTLKSGIAAKRSFSVGRDSTIGFMGEEARVYATPMLVRDIEFACRNLLLGHLDPGEDSVGTRVEVDHLAATLLGMSATLTVTVIGVKGRAVTFEVTGSDSVEPICRGRHGRFVIDIKTTEQRLAAKAKQAGLA